MINILWERESEVWQQHLRKQSSLGVFKAPNKQVVSSEQRSSCKVLQKSGGSMLYLYLGDLTSDSCVQYSSILYGTIVTIIN